MNSNRTSPARGRPLDKRKRALMLESAQALFIEHGFSGTSMDAIAARASVSKVTLYHHFRSKSGLFQAAIAAKIEIMLDAVKNGDITQDEPREALVRFGQLFLNFVLSPEAVAIHRLIANEWYTHPELGQLFFETAIVPVRSRVEALISHIGITIDDPQKAASNLLSLLRSKPVLEMELGLSPLGVDQRRAHVAHCVDFCLFAWRTAASG